METAAPARTPHPDKLRGLLVAAVIALGMSAFKDLFLPAFFHFDPVYRAASDTAAGPYLIFGLGISMAICGLVGYPVWLAAEAHDLESPVHAATIGAALASILAILLLALSHDAITAALTAGNRFLVIFSVLWTIATGAVAGFAARLSAGRVKPAPEQKARE